MIEFINKSVTVIIRSVSERSEHLCRELILSQGISNENIILVKEFPFSASLRKSYEIGKEQQRRWTFCVDADLLLRPFSIEKMVQIFEKQPKGMFEIQGYILDKFFGGPRIGGIHLYRTSLLEKGLKCIPIDESELRPESRTLIKMKELGFPYLVVPYVVGLHDFEQYYRDIFRKCFVQARKHQMFLDLFVSYWQTKAKEDKDFEVALKGLANGIEYIGDVGIDANNAMVNNLFYKLKIKEKEPLNQTNLDQIEKVINNWQEPKEYQKKFPDRMGLGKEYSYQSGNSPKSLGKFKPIFYYFGAALLKISELQKKLAVTLIKKNSDK